VRPGLLLEFRERVSDASTRASARRGRREAGQEQRQGQEGQELIIPSNPRSIKPPREQSRLELLPLPLLYFSAEEVLQSRSSLLTTKETQNMLELPLSLKQVHVWVFLLFLALILLLFVSAEQAVLHAQEQAVSAPSCRAGTCQGRMTM